MPVLSPRPIHWYHRIDGRLDFQVPTGSLVIALTDVGPRRCQTEVQQPFILVLESSRFWVRKGSFPTLPQTIQFQLGSLVRSGSSSGLEDGTLYGVVLYSEEISAQTVREVTTRGPDGRFRTAPLAIVRDNVLGLDSVPQPIEAITVALAYSNAVLEPRFSKYPEFGSLCDSECCLMGLPIYPHPVEPPREIRNRFQREPVI